MTHRLAISLLERSIAPCPLYRQIAEAIERDIASGRFRSGDRLPSIRILARQLDVARKTVRAAFTELEKRGRISCLPRSGVFIADVAPGRATLRAREAARVPRFDHARVTLPRRPVSPRARFDLLGGVPALDTAPTVELARAFRRSLARDRGHALMDYGDARGLERLRAAFASWLARTRGLSVGIDAIHVVRGAQNGLYLAGRALLKPGDRVATEAYLHPSASALFRLLELEIVPVPVDDAGMRIGALEALDGDRTIRAVYITPHHQLPSTATLSPARRDRLLELARERRWMIFEDDYDHEFQYTGNPILPLAYQDRHGAVIYFGTLSKVVAPGLRMAFVVAPPPVIERIAAYRRFVDVQGDQILECAIADLLEDGEIERHVQRTLRIYRARREALCEALSADLPMLRFTPPRGGMALWAHAPGIDVDAWARKALHLGVSFQPASLFACGDVPLDYARIGFAACSATALREAVRLMARALPR
ncbi:MAG TPA: PLP-dependent aminotransferase family protein [Kofleriaceae bacterium]|nr:PLP-dependent aminotransferase family protein [Kofleriaceae bacterium]